MDTMASPCVVTNFCLDENSLMAAHHYGVPDFTSPRIFPAVDAAGTQLPILLSTLFDHLEIGQAEMWKVWYNRRNFKTICFLPEGENPADALCWSKRVCSHLVFQCQFLPHPAAHDPEACSVWYHCPWCDFYETYPPSRYLLMQCITECQHEVPDEAEVTRHMAVHFDLPSDDIGSWQLSDS